MKLVHLEDECQKRQEKKKSRVYNIFVHSQHFQTVRNAFRNMHSADDGRSLDGSGKYPDAVMQETRTTHGGCTRARGKARSDPWGHALARRGQQRLSCTAQQPSGVPGWGQRLPRPESRSAVPLGLLPQRLCPRWLPKPTACASEQSGTRFRRAAVADGLCLLPLAFGFEIIS